MSDIRAVVWRSSKESNVYLFQIETYNKRDLNKVIKEIGGKVTGGGYDSKKKQTITLMAKEFESKDKLLGFAKGLSFALAEISQRTGKERIINGKRKQKK